MSHTTRYLQGISLVMISFVMGCGNPRVNGAAGASPSPSLPRTPPAGAIKPEPVVTPVIAIAVPADLQQRIRQLTLIDVVDLALLNNPATRASWAQARATAYLFGSAQGQYYPTINGTATASRIKSPATLARPA